MKINTETLLGYLVILLIGIATILTTGVAVPYVGEEVWHFATRYASYIPTWFWQIVIGLATFMGGGGLLASVPLKEENPTIFQRLRVHPGWVMMLIGTTVALNFGRYDEIIGETGSWPLYGLGGAMVYAGLVMATLVLRGKNPVPEEEELAIDEAEVVG